MFLLCSSGVCDPVHNYLDPCIFYWMKRLSHIFVCVLQLTENRFRKVFEKYGAVTDLSLKYTKNGVFRCFGFVGYHKPEEARKAVKECKYIDSTKIQVSLSIEILQ